MESLLLEPMYTVPDDDRIEKITITEAAVEGDGKPVLTLRDGDGAPAASENNV